jgi:hypothetical protein
MYGVMADFALDPSWSDEVREFGEEGVDRSTAADDFHAGY